MRKVRTCIIEYLDQFHIFEIIAYGNIVVYLLKQKDITLSKTAVVLNG